MSRRLYIHAKWLYILLTIVAYGYHLPAFAHTSNILVFGDSLSAGYGLERGQEWPRLLQQQLSMTKLPFVIVNHSISGETTAGGLTRFKASLKQTSPAIVILELGANDGLRGLSLKAMKQNLQQMIDAARQQNIPVVLVGMKLPSNYGPGYTRLFHQQFEQLAQVNQLAFVPFLMGELDTGLKMYQPDGLHPTADAQPQMMQNVWQVLKPILTP